VITVGVERSAEDAREWIEAARPTHPSLIDTEHLLADRYNMVNVPTVVWIDERGRIARPNDVAFTSDRSDDRFGLSTPGQMAALRAWVRGESEPLPAARVRELQALPTAADQRARAHFGLGNWLYQHDRLEAAARHFETAGELAPHDFMIRRGTMPIVGQDPFGDEFRAMMREWTEAGNPYYRPLRLDHPAAEA
jgi:hypothetical protein